MSLVYMDVNVCSIAIKCSIDVQRLSTHLSEKTAVHLQLKGKRTCMKRQACTFWTEKTGKDTTVKVE